MHASVLGELLHTDELRPPSVCCLSLGHSHGWVVQRVVMQQRQQRRSSLLQAWTGLTNVGAYPQDQNERPNENG